jgi:hypothetical protein
MHQYTIINPFTAVEATAPPAEVHGRDNIVPAIESALNAPNWSGRGLLSTFPKRIPKKNLIGNVSYRRQGQAALTLSHEPVAERVPAATQRALMASFKPPAQPFRKSFQPDELEFLGQTFNAIWAAIKTGESDGDSANVEELRAAVSKRLCALAAGGVTDPEILRDLTLATILRGPKRSRARRRAR